MRFHGTASELFHLVEFFKVAHDSSDPRLSYMGKKHIDQAERDYERARDREKRQCRRATLEEQRRQAKAEGHMCNERGCYLKAKAPTRWCRKHNWHTEYEAHAVIVP